MKILIFSYYLPYNDLDLYTLKDHFKTLSQDNEIILVCGVRSGEQALLEDVSKFCAKIYPVNLHLPDITWKIKDISLKIFLNGIANCLRFLFLENLTRGKPLILPMVFFFRRELSLRLKEAIGMEKPAVVILHKMITAVHKKDIPDYIPAVFFDDDALSRLFFTSMITESNMFAKAYYLLRYLGTRRWEGLLFPGFRRVALLSDKDKDWLIKIHPSLSNIESIPRIVDSEIFKPDFQEEDFPSLIFFGVLSNSYNKEAVESFADRILPSLREGLPQLKFYIVGPYPSRKIRKLSQDPLNKVISEVTGQAKDLQAYIAKSTICIAPLYRSVGIKSKILFSMSMGKAVVATKVATEGIKGLKNGENIVIADTPSEFAERVTDLVKNREMNRMIGKKARELVTEIYTRENWKRCWSRVCNEVVNG